MFFEYDADAMEAFVMRHLRRERLVEKSTGPLTEIQSMILDSCLARGDIEQAEKDIADWNTQRVAASRRTEYVSKWVPGDHYYALDQKFDTLAKAKAHLKRRGYAYGGLRERFQYRSSGG